MTLEEIKNKIIPILRSHNVGYAALFGSVVRGEAGPDSDVDILIRFDKTPGFFGYLELKEQLEGVLGHSVDLPTVRSLNKHVRSHVYKDLLTLYGRQE